MRHTWLHVLLAVVMLAGPATLIAAQNSNGSAAAKAAHPAPAKVELAAAERDLLADVKDGELRALSFAEAALIASGVIDAGKRKPYLAKIDALAGQARRATAGAKTPSHKGEKLLKFLHAKSGGPLKKYAKHQTSLAVLLDTGSFNCVSSAVLYNVLAGRLGLDVRAVELPDHAFSVLRDGGKSVDVETTTSQGFDPKREKGKAAALARDRREIGCVDLLAIVFANRCVGLGKEKRFPEAVRAGMCAVGLGPDLRGPQGNLRASLCQWCNELASGGKLEDALAVLESNGASLDARSRRDHLKGIYGARLRVLVKNGEHQAAARMYADAGARHRADAELAEHCRRQALACFDEWAHPLMKAGKWSEALDVYKRAGEILPDDAHVREKLEMCEKKLRP